MQAILASTLFSFLLCAFVFFVLFFLVCVCVWVGVCALSFLFLFLVCFGFFFLRQLVAEARFISRHGLLKQLHLFYISFSIVFDIYIYASTKGQLNYKPRL